MTEKGYVQWVGSKPMSWGLVWSFRLKNVEKWFGTGKMDPKINVGDHIEFEYSEVKGRNEVNLGSLRKLESSPQVHQGTPSSALSAPAASNGRSDYALKEQYWNDKAKNDVQKDLRIQWQSARNAAIEVVGVLVKASALQLPAKNQSEAILGKVADLTEKFYSESIHPPGLDRLDNGPGTAENAEAA